jgi:hypothetical protein
MSRAGEKDRRGSEVGCGLHLPHCTCCLKESANEVGNP